jgi:hypothetical protein
MEFRDLSPVGRDYPAGFGEFLEEHFDLGTLQPTGAAQLFGLFKKRSDTVAWSSRTASYLRSCRRRPCKRPSKSWPPSGSVRYR